MTGGIGECIQQWAEEEAALLNASLSSSQCSEIAPVAHAAKAALAHDVKGGFRSNRNVEVETALRAAIEKWERGSVYSKVYHFG